MGTVTKGRNRSDRVPERRRIVKGAAGAIHPVTDDFVAGLGNVPGMG